MVMKGYSGDISLKRQLKSTERLDLDLAGQDLINLRFMLNMEADADAAVGAEVAGHGDELICYPLFFEEFFGAQRTAY
jgi:hypothetical protein